MEQMAKTSILSDQVYPKGKYDSSAMVFPVDGDFVVIALDRSTWPDTGRELIEIDLSLSLDAGKTWQPIGGVKARGGIMLGKDGIVRTEQKISVGPIPEPKSTGRRIRVSLDVQSPLRTKADANTITHSAPSDAVK
jgi:hypothetical protein